MSCFFDSDSESSASPPGEDGARLQGPRPEPGGEAADSLCLGNTKSPSSHVKLSIDGIGDVYASGGVDWFEWSIWVQVERLSVLLGALDLLREAKESAQSTSQQLAQVHLPEFGPVNVSRQGKTRGRTNGTHYEFQLQIPGVTIAFSERVLDIAKAERQKRPQPQLYALQTGRDCLLYGAVEGYENTSAFLTALGLVPVRETISRGDLCLDLCGLPTSFIVELCKHQCFVTRARRVKPEEDLSSEQCTGLSIGKNPKRLNIYDKFREVIRKGDALYLEALLQRRWGEHASFNSTRVEFQLWRETLQKYDILTPSQFLDHRRSLIDDLCQNYFRLTDVPVDREGKHQSRAATHQCWLEIVRAFQQLFAEPQQALPPIDREKVDPKRLVQMGRGCLLNALVQMGAQFETYEQFAQQCMKILVKLFPQRDERQQFMEQVAIRRLENETS